MNLLTGEVAMNLRVGAPVFANDGQVGQLDRIVLDPQTHQVAGIIAIQGWLLSHDVAIPAAWIGAADESGVRINATAEQVDSLDSVTHSQYNTPPEDWIPPDGTVGAQFLFPASPYAVGAFTMPPPQLAAAEEEVVELGGADVAINDGTPVFCTDGGVGTVSRVITGAADSHIAALVVDVGGVASRLVAVPVDQVTSIGDERINLALSQRELDLLPEWQPVEEAPLRAAA